MHLIADEAVLFRSPYPKEIFCFTPSICMGFDGRVIAGLELSGPGIRKLGEPLSDGSYGNHVRIFLSDDHGKSWRDSSSRLPMVQEVLFKAGNALYALGHKEDVAAQTESRKKGINAAANGQRDAEALKRRHLCISKSVDNGESWCEPVVLDESNGWHQSSCNIDFHNGKLYLVYEIFSLHKLQWPGVMQVLMSANVNDDLTKRENWRFSEPFNADGLCESGRAFCNLPDDKHACGILETNVVRMKNSHSMFWDPDDRSVLLVCRVSSWSNNIAAFLRGVEQEDGQLRIEPWNNRTTGLPLFYAPFPGGCLKFHVGFDEVSELYWLVANNPRETNFRDGVEDLSDRRQMCLWYSRNCFDWNFAGTVAFGPSENGARSYAQFVIDGEDMIVICRSGDEDASTDHDNNLTTVHRIQNFRGLIDLT